MYSGPSDHGFLGCFTPCLATHVSKLKQVLFLENEFGNQKKKTKMKMKMNSIYFKIRTLHLLLLFENSIQKRKENAN